MRITPFVLLGSLVCCHDARTTTTATPPAHGDLVVVDAGPTTPSPVSAVDAGPESPKVETTEKVIDAGTIPLRPLVYAFATTERAIAAVVTVAAPGGEQTFRFGLTVTPALQTDGARLAIRMTSVDFSIPGPTTPETANAKAAIVKAIVGSTGHANVTSRGALTDFELADVPRDAAEVLNMVTQSFEMLFIPLPSEPVGVGAKWSRTSRTMSRDLALASTATMTLVARDAQTATVKLTTTNVGSMAVTDPRAPAGTRIARTTTATFDVVARLDGPSRKVDGESQNAITQTVPGQPDQTVTIKVAQHVTSK